MTRKTRNLPETVRRPSTNAQTPDRFMFTRNQARKAFLEHETFLHRNFILRRTVADALQKKRRHIKHLQIPKLPLLVKPRTVCATRLSPGKGFPLGHMQVTGRFWTRGKAKSRSIGKTIRSRSNRCASC